MIFTILRIDNLFFRLNKFTWTVFVLENKISDQLHSDSIATSNLFLRNMLPDIRISNLLQLTQGKTLATSWLVLSAWDSFLLPQFLEILFRFTSRVTRSH